ncbi:MAG: hypothetical protein IVW36_01625 [Dehalococcoidia bacterium]|nr:hypothetical protein [Dehalococcoidia bacterium]
MRTEKAPAINRAPTSTAAATSPAARPKAIAPATVTPARPTATAAPPAATATAAPPPPRPPSLFDNAQVVAFYGSPISGALGVLGRFPPQEMASWLLGEAGIYDALNGNRGVVPALDLIYSQAQADPTANGLYLRYLDDATVQRYIALAEQRGLQLILDLQIGRGDILGEVQKIGAYLANPRVHLAIDPEYAVGPNGVPIETPGVITGDQINAVQAYLNGIVQANNLPPKLFVIHQFMDQTVVNGEVTQRFPGVDLVLNMDAYGDARGKADKYRLFAGRPYAQHRSYNVFLKLDAPVASEQDVMNLTPQPDMVEYQ